MVHLVPQCQFQEVSGPAALPSCLEEDNGGGKVLREKTADPGLTVTIHDHLQGGDVNMTEVSCSLPSPPQAPAAVLPWAVVTAVPPPRDVRAMSPPRSEGQTLTQ